MRAKIFFILALLIPLVVLIWQLFNGQLGAQPSEEMNHKLGELTYRLLAVNLAWGSLLALGWMPKRIRRFSLLRRHLGVVTFFYALLHVTFYVLKEGDVGVALSQLFEKTYLVIGMSALLILCALTITSNNLAMRKLKKNWKKLHRLAYLAFALATVHFGLIEKEDWYEVLPVAAPLLLLYLLRIYRSQKPSVNLSSP